MRAFAGMTLVACLAVGACVPPQGQTDPKTGVAQSQPTFADMFKKPQKAGAPAAGPSEVSRVVCFYRPNPFLSFDREGDPDPEGFTFTLYLISRANSKGVLESGTLNVKMFVLDPRASGNERRALIREWTTPTDGLVQSNKPHPLFGMGYQPQFRWEKTDDVLGREIEIVAAFTTRDGRNIQGQTKALRAPEHGG